MRTWLNLALFLAALAGSLVLAAGGSGRAAAAPAAIATTEVRDAAGRAVPVRAYHRIVSLTVITDPLLPELVEVERVVAGSAWSRGPLRFKLGNRPRLTGPEEVETLLALDPDLVLIAGTSTAAVHVERLRARGVEVFDIGAITGWSGFVRTARDLGALLGAPERAERVIAAGEARFAALAARPPARRLTAAYAGVHDRRIYGGAEGTSYHDVIVRAGLVDATTGRHRGWPEYTVEDLLALDPDLIVTNQGQAEDLRRLPAADRLRARIVELPADLLEDPGILIPEAAEALRAAVDGSP